MTTIPIHPETKGLIFDIDGTLVDTMPIHYKACQIVCNKYGFDFPLDFFYAHAGIPTIPTFHLLKQKLQLDFDADKLGLEKEEKYMEIITEVKPLKEVFEVVLHYQGKLPMSLGTGATREVALRNLEAAGISGMFDIIVTAEDVINHKPSPDTFLLCAEKMGIAPEFCQVFEDANPGIAAAKAGGMKVIDIREYVKNNIAK
jgi:HAD superfamily hydrolase (TIGR01509 family)